MTWFSKRALVSVLLSLFFLIAYGSSEAVAGHRVGVPSVYFDWERGVPFVALMIVPYMSIDLFFVTAPLLLKTDRQLRVYATRIVTAIGIASAVFLLYPLRFAFTRPAVAGPLGVIFDQFRRADLPFNQLPSLHVALLILVGDVFLTRFRGLSRTMLLGWFTLIAASPWLVYQHHLVDLLAGMVLGLACVRLIPDAPRPPFERNVRVGAYYFAAGILALLVCLSFGARAWPLWWPLVSLLLVAAAYWFVGPSIYGKTDGQLPWSTRLLFAPTLLGQHLSHRWYARQCRPFDAIHERLWIGRQLSRKQAVDARVAGVGAVVDLTGEFDRPAAFVGLPYLQLPTLDLTAPTQSQIREAVEFIQKHERTAIVYVHCKVGYSRTAVIAAAYLIRTGRTDTPDRAIGLVRGVRPTLIVRPEAREAIERFWALSPISGRFPKTTT